MSLSLLPWILHVLAGLIVLAEALNKLERCELFGSGLTRLQHTAQVLKALAWMLLALGSGGAVAGPVLLYMGADMTWLPDLIHIEAPTLDDVATMVGFAVLVVRTRVKEG
jgi:hypothetical protein